MKNKIYLAKKNTWFKENTKCQLIETYGDCEFALFEGVYVVSDEPYDNFWHKRGYSKGEGVIMTEICRYDEFIITYEDRV